MTVANVDYSKLMVLPSVLQAFEDSVRRTLALQASHLMPLNSIKLQLMPGSVRVSARVASLDDAEASNWTTKLRSSPTIRDRLATSIEGVNGIAAACTGPVSVTSFETSSEIKLSTGPGSSLVTCALLIALIGLSILFVLGMAALAMVLLGNIGVTSARRSVFYDLLTDESRSDKAAGHRGSHFDLEAEPDHDLERDGENEPGTLQLSSSRSAQVRGMRNVRAGAPRKGGSSPFSSVTGETLETILEGSEGSPRSVASTIVSTFTA